MNKLSRAKEIWTIEEINYLRKNYPNKGTALCSEKLQRSTVSIRHKASRIKLKANRIAYAKRSEKRLMDNFDKSNKPLRDTGAWKKRVLIRDKYICQSCRLYNPKIVLVHHIKNSSEFPDLKFDISNGITLCPNCHAEIHFDAGRKNSGKRLSKQDKKLIRDLSTLGKSISEIATILSINKKTVYEYK